MSPKPSSSVHSSDSSGISDTDMDTSISPSSPMSSVRTLPNSRTAEEHPRYHFHDGSLTFALNGLEYCVHASLLARHCGFTSTWAEDLRDPATAGITHMDLDNFFAMMYTSAYQAADMSFSIENWISILRIATRWKAGDMRDASIRALSCMVSPLDKLLLSRAYDISAWLAPACAAFALHQAPFTTEEIKVLGKDGMASVLRARKAVSSGLVHPIQADITIWLSNDLASSSASPSRPVSPGVAAVSESSAGRIPSSERPTLKISPPKSPKHTMSASAPPFQPRTFLTDTGPVMTTAVTTQNGFASSRTAQDAFVRKQYGAAFSMVPAGSEDAIAETVAPLLFDAGKGAVIKDSLLDVFRAATHHAIAHPDFIPIGAQFLASLVTRLRGVNIGTLLRPDLRSLSSNWNAVCGGFHPTPDRGRLMPDVNLGRDAYIRNIDNGKEFFKALIRFSVVPEKDPGIRLVMGLSEAVQAAPAPADMAKFRHVHCLPYDESTQNLRFWIDVMPIRRRLRLSVLHATCAASEVKEPVLRGRMPAGDELQPKPGSFVIVLVTCNGCPIEGLNRRKDYKSHNVTVGK
ncbi:hypothetical protein PENSPDRAFT_734744 [Peniophora sp. CONT]|nr:hypothetical protein PENSPDRAFT_734744 [Peniophora sp. CONT]